MVAVRAGNEYVGGIHGSCNVSSAADGLGMNAARGIRGVCMCVTSGRCGR